MGRPFLPDTATMYSNHVHAPGRYAEAGGCASNFSFRQDGICQRLDVESRKIRMPCKYLTSKEPCERFGRRPFETMGRDTNENCVWQINVEGAGERMKVDGAEEVTPMKARTRHFIKEWKLQEIRTLEAKARQCVNRQKRTRMRRTRRMMKKKSTKKKKKYNLRKNLIPAQHQ